MGDARWNSAARSGLPWMLLGMALAWGAGVGGPPSVSAQGPLGVDRGRPSAGGEQGSQGSASGTIALTATLGSGAQLLYLVDTRLQSLAIYRVDPTTGNNSKGSLKLEAQRHYGQDLKLTEFNNAPPEVRSIEAMVRTLPPK
ncbi:hypothetical protein EP7_002693 [Isosphaeraceae bacterium EP7]